MKDGVEGCNSRHCTASVATIIWCTFELYIQRSHCSILRICCCAAMEPYNKITRNHYRFPSSLAIPSLILNSIARQPPTVRGAQFAIEPGWPFMVTIVTKSPRDCGKSATTALAHMNSNYNGMSLQARTLVWPRGWEWPLIFLTFLPRKFLEEWRSSL